MAVAGALLAIVRSARALTVVVVVLLVLLVEGVPLPSSVPVVLTVAVLDRIVPFATPEPTVTWTVNTVVAFTARVTVRLQVTTWPAAVQSTLEPVALNVAPAGRV